MKKIVDCRLKRNTNQKRCKFLIKLRGKSKKSLNWKQAKIKYPWISSKGDIDKDYHKNINDCKPFDPKKHMTTITSNEGKEIILSNGEYKAFQLIKYGRGMGLPPSETHKELKEHGLTSSQMRAGLGAFNAFKFGKGKVEVRKGIEPTIPYSY